MKLHKWVFFVLAIAVYVIAENAGKQRMVILLKDPIETKHLNVKIQGDLETLSEKKEKDAKPVLQEITESNISFSFNRMQQRTLTLNLEHSGFVTLEVRDFQGKLISVLVEDYLSKGKYVFEENDTWKSLRNLKGLAFISLSVDGKQVLRKLMAKMD